MMMVLTWVMSLITEYSAKRKSAKDLPDFYRFILNEIKQKPS